MNEITNRLIIFKNSQVTKQLRKLQSTTSLMEIYGINRKEIRHTSFLRWLFSSECPVSQKALGLFIDILIESKFFKKDSINDAVYNKLLFGNYNLISLNATENYAVERRAIDLKIEFAIDDFKFNIVIENKVYSNEYNTQTQWYYDCINKQFPECVNFFVYLTPVSNLELELLQEPQCECKNYIQINYQLILDKILTPILQDELDSTTKYFLEDYIMALTIPVNANTNKHMAISKDESALLTLFWEQNKDLILKAVEATIDNSHIEPENREIAKEISKLLIQNDEKIGAYVKKNLRQLASDNKLNPETIYLLLEKDFSKKTFNINYALLIKAENTSPIHYWRDIIKINDMDYYICCEWFEYNRINFDNWLKTFSNQIQD